jgi:uracil-DNA glycosylase
MIKDPLNIVNYKCKKCSLHKQRTNVVWGSGTYKSKIAFIGEAPGYNEDLSGNSFVGVSGKILNEALRMVSILEKIDINRNNVLCLNIVKCRPPSNINPRPEQITECLPFLFKQLLASDVTNIMTLGLIAWDSLTNHERIKVVSESTIKKIKLQWHLKEKTFKVYSNMHPAYICRNKNAMKLFVKNMRECVRSTYNG